MGADECGAEGARAPICNVRHELTTFMMEAQGSGCREDPPAGGLVRLGADTLQKNKFMMEAKASGCQEDQPAGGLVRHGADTL